MKWSWQSTLTRCLANCDRGGDQIRRTASGGRAGVRRARRAPAFALPRTRGWIGHNTLGSAIKVFILVEALRQADDPDVVATLAGRQLALDASVWSFDSPVLNAPDLTGTVSERTAMEAMISHSDNTATDIMSKQAGPEAVRAFLASAGFTSTAIPDSTRSYVGYLKGASDYPTFTWEQLVATADDPFVNPVLNPTSTLASSADDLVSVYSRAMPGEFFEHDETLNSLRTTLSMGDLIWVVPFPLGATAFGKGGGFDAGNFHAVCAPGAPCFDDG
jgi:beta-lactamase class A